MTWDHSDGSSLFGGADALEPLSGTFEFSSDTANQACEHGNCTYTYAPTGERVSSVCSSGTTDYAYDRGPAAAGNVLATYTASGAQTARYLDSGGLNSPVEAYQGGAHYAYQADGLGSVRMLTGGSQNATDTYAYDAWGNTLSSSGNVANPLQYAGAMFDPTTSLYDMRARFYDPGSGGAHRFLSQDPAGGGYAYVGDSPASFVDPSGAMRAAPRAGGGSGPSADNYCDGWVAAQGLCGSISARGATGGTPGGTGGSPQPTTQESWLDKCGVDWGIFVVAAIVGLLGINADPASMEGVAVFVVSAFGPDMYGTLRSITTSDPVGVIIAFAQLLFDFGATVFEKILVGFVRGFFAVMQAMLGFGEIFVPGALEVKLGIWLVSQFFAVGSLAEEGCL